METKFTVVCKLGIEMQKWIYFYRCLSTWTGSSVMLLSWNCQWTRWRGLMSLSTWSEKLTSTIKVRGPAQHNKDRKGKKPMIYLTQQWKCLCALKIMHAPYLGQLNLQRYFWSQIIRLKSGQLAYDMVEEIWDLKY